MIETILIAVFGAIALTSAALMLVLRHPMRVALALVTTMLCLGAIYGLIGVHAIAVFQVLIYVGAVMVFMVYVIMLLDLRDASFQEPYSHWLVPGAAVAFVLFVAVFLMLGAHSLAEPISSAAGTFDVKAFSATFLNDFWLHFELVSVLLVAAVVGALAVIIGKAPGR